MADAKAEAFGLKHFGIMLGSHTSGQNFGDHYWSE
jgi:hypothetical protein